MAAAWPKHPVIYEVNTEALWGTRVSPSTVSELNRKIYVHIDAWRNRPIGGEHPYVFLDGIWLKRAWGGEVQNVAVLVAIAVGRDGRSALMPVAAHGDHCASDCPRDSVNRRLACRA